MPDKQLTVLTSSPKAAAEKRPGEQAQPDMQNLTSMPVLSQAKAEPGKMSAANVLTLQRWVGNHSVQRMLARSTVVPAARGFGTVGSKLIGAQGMVQRAVTQQAWDTKILPKLSNTDYAVFTTDGNADLKKLVRNTPAGLEVMDSAVKTWGPLANLPAFLQGHTWTEKFRTSKGDLVDFTAQPVLHSNLDLTKGNVPMNVQDVEGDRHNFVHHSYATYQIPGKAKGKNKPPPGQRRESGHHLTVENAHLLAMLVAESEKTLAASSLDKTKLDKPGVNKQLEARGVTELDNLNFFPARAAQTSKPLGLTEQQLPTDKLPEGADPGGEEVDPSLSLQDYLNFIQTALSSIPGLSPLYGAKILHTAQKMAELTGLDPAQMFLKVGKGDQRQLLRAVLSIDKNNLAPGLDIPADVRAVFSFYVTDKPKLPFALAINDQTEWVAKGALAKDLKTNYNELEDRYVNLHYPAVIHALKIYIQ